MNFKIGDIVRKKGEPNKEFRVWSVRWRGLSLYPIKPPGGHFIGAKQDYELVANTTSLPVGNQCPVPGTSPKFKVGDCIEFFITGVWLTNQISAINFQTQEYVFNIGYSFYWSVIDATAHLVGVNAPTGSAVNNGAVPGGLDALIDSESDNLYGLYGVETQGCVHVWTSYTGLSESFEYCKKCDKKSL